MIYLQSEQDCLVAGVGQLRAGARYVLEDVKDESLLFVAQNCYPQCINLFDVCVLKQNCPGCVRVEHGGSTFLFFKFKPTNNLFCTQFKFNGADVCVNLSNSLAVLVNGKIVLQVENCGFEFNNFKLINNICIISFLGERKFVVVLKGQECVYANFADKTDVLDKEFYFLARQKDCLNHGRVCHIKNGEVEDYLVFLDDYDLNLKPQFLPHAFLDCVLSKNFKYCNALLAENLKQQNEKQIANFFCEFDKFFALDAAPINQLEQNLCAPVEQQNADLGASVNTGQGGSLAFALIKKDALAGICEFEIENNSIANIKIF